MSTTSPAPLPYRAVPPLFNPNGVPSLFGGKTYEFVLAAVTLAALLAGWLGGEVSEQLPGWSVALLALVAFAAGGYAGLIGAWEQARRGRFDVDFLMLAAALGAALIGEWTEGALLLFCLR
jgi:Cd2+/Zn2+-exporting ATPase